MLENIREKYRKMQVERERKDIETIRKKPRAWKAYMIVTAIAYIGLIGFLLVVGVYPLAFIAIVFLAWLTYEMLVIYRKAIPKSN